MAFKFFLSADMTDDKPSRVAMNETISINFEWVYIIQLNEKLVFLFFILIQQMSLFLQTDPLIFSSRDSVCLCL